MNKVFILEDSQATSRKETTRTREKGVFNSIVEGWGLAVGKWAYVSHKEWLKVLGDRVSSMKPLSIKNGPRYSLKALGYDCVAINLSGPELERVAESEDRNISDNPSGFGDNSDIGVNDRVYEITKSVEVK